MTDENTAATEAPDDGAQAPVEQDQTPKPKPPPKGKSDEEKEYDGPPASKGLQEALIKERERRRQAEGRVGELESVQSQLDAITKALGMTKEDETPDPAAITAELEESRRAAAENAAALVRYKTAVEKQVPSHLVEFITGSTPEEVEASIEKVMAAFGASKPAGPRPDPSQGVQGAPASLDALIADAQKRGDIREVIRLKSSRALANPTN